MKATPPLPAQRPSAGASGAPTATEKPHCKATAFTFMDGSESLWREVVAASIPEFDVLLRDAHAALEAHDGARLRRAAHTIKGLCACLAAEPARRAALTLEHAARDGLGSAALLLSVLADEIARLVQALGVEGSTGEAGT